MEPLSVPASVVGLLTAAAQVSLILKNLISKSTHAPKSLSDLEREVDAVHLALGQLEAYLTRKALANPSREALVLVEKVVVVLSGTVFTFSELQSIVEAFDSDDRMGLMDRLRWVSKAETIAEISSRVEKHKTSLMLMLQILSGQSQLEAEKAAEQLSSQVEQLLSINRLLKHRLRAQESNAPTIAPDDGDFNEDKDLTTAIQSSSSQIQSFAMGFSFEKDLNSSWAYKRIKKNLNVDSISLSSSDRRTTSWSFFSGLSITEVSNISVLELLVYKDEISNPSLYRFGSQSPEASIRPDKNTKTPGLLTHTSMEYQLVRLRQETNKYGERKYHPIHVACKKGHADVVNELLRRGADVNAKAKYIYAKVETANEDLFCITPLLLAIRHKQRQTFDLLVNHPQIDVHVKTAFKRTVLHYAAEWGDLDVFEKLLNLGLDPLQKDTKGNAAWHVAAGYGHLSVLKLICQNEPVFDVDVRDSFDRTALMHAAKGGFLTVCKFLMNLGASLENCDKLDQAPIHYAAGAEDSQVLENLISLGADLNRRDRYGRTALHFASGNGRTKQVSICLRQGLDPNSQTILGETPLLFAAAEAMDEETCAHLLTKTADPQIHDIAGKTVLDYVNQYSRVYRPFKQYMIDYEPWTPEMRRSRIKTSLGMILSDEKLQRKLSSEITGSDFQVLADLFLNHGEYDKEARICLETLIIRLQNNRRRFSFPCFKCRAMINAAAWYSCRQCYSLYLCQDCHAKRISGKITVQGCLSSHTYLEFGADQWQKLPPGKVNEKGQTKYEWLDEQKSIFCKA